MAAAAISKFGECACFPSLKTLDGRHFGVLGPETPKKGKEGSTVHTLNGNKNVHQAKHVV